MQMTDCSAQTCKHWWLWDKIFLRWWHQEGAVDVFLDFISYSGGPLAEDLLEVITQPVSILWGKPIDTLHCLAAHSRQHARL